jgi:hypothetical protein
MTTMSEGEDEEEEKSSQDPLACVIRLEFEQQVHVYTTLIIFFCLCDLA